MPRVPLLAALLLATATSLHAAPLTAVEVFQQFNLVTLGDAAVGSHTDGRAYVGGTLTGSGAVFAMHPGTMPASAYAGLTVAGDASGFHVTAGGLTALGNVSNGIVNNGPAAVAGNAAGSSFNGSGGAYVGGTVSGVNANSGALAEPAAAIMFDIAQSTDFGAVLRQASSSLAAAASTGSWWSVNGSRVTFHAVAGADGVAVFDLTAVDHWLLGLGEFEFDLGQAQSVILNSDLETAVIHANFIAGGATAWASRLLWNFHGTQSLTLASQFGGSVLAIDAALSNGNNIEGGVYVDTLAQHGEIHQGAFGGSLPHTGELPEPASAALVLLALGAAVGARRRSGLRPSSTRRPRPGATAASSAAGRAG